MGSLVTSLFSILFSFGSAEDKQLNRALYAITNCKPGNLALYNLALRHSSEADDKGSNERLEYLGDAALSLIVAEYLFRKYPLQEEGFLTEVRSRIVNRASLGTLAKQIGLNTLLCYDKKTVRQGGGGKYIYGNALEALIGAVYLDKGYECCRRFVVNQLLHLHMDLEELVQTDTNYKSQLINWANTNRKSVQFEITSEQRTGGRSKEFTAQVTFDEEVLGEGKGSNKKQAEQQAAEVALATLN